MNIKIMKMEEQDIPEVVDIQIGGWQTAYKGIIEQEFLDSMDREKKIEKTRNNFKQRTAIVAKIDDEVVGFCRYTAPANGIYAEEYDSEIVAIYVKPNKKGLGIGKEMFKYVQNEFRRLNKNKMLLWCLKENYPSRAFYEKMGGKLAKEKEYEIGGKIYLEVGFEYDL